KNNQLVGQTNASGDLLISNLNSYMHSEISINDQDIPLTAEIPFDKTSVFPNSQGAFLVDFLPTKLHAKTLRVVTEDLKPLDPGCIINWSNNESSIVGYDGEIYVSTDPKSKENIVGTVFYDNSTCY